jgi:hypothetical protein
MPSMQALEAARKIAETRYLGQPHVHRVEIGEVTENGKPTGEVGVVVVVTDKGVSAQMAPADQIPRYLRAPDTGEQVRVDIQQAPMAKDRRLWGDPAALSFTSLVPLAGDPRDWQRCFPCPIPGGVQIAPERANWVGTLSCAVRFKNADGQMKYGALTNYHVAVSAEQRGLKIGQPDGHAGDWFAKLDRWSAMQKNAQNRVDAAVLDTWREDGKYAPGCHTVKPVQHAIGAINPNPQREQRIGDRVQKSGRTTAHTTGRVVGIKSTSQVDYGDLGVLTFVDQTVVRADSGHFSQGGDSGSLVLTEDRRPYGLLFAGGGSDTIINPIGFVIDMFELEFFAA